MQELKEFAISIGVTPEQFEKIYKDFSQKAESENMGERFIYLQVKRYLKKVQLNPQETFKAVYIGADDLKDWAASLHKQGIKTYPDKYTGKAGQVVPEHDYSRSLYFIRNKQLLTLNLRGDAALNFKLPADFSEVEIISSCKENKIYWNDLSRITEIREITNVKEFISQNLGDNIIRDNNDLFKAPKDFAIMILDILDIDVRNDRAIVLFQDDKIPMEKTIQSWIDISKVTFTSEARDIIIIANTYIKDDNQTVNLNIMSMYVPEQYRKPHVEELKDDEEELSVEKFLS